MLVDAHTHLLPPRSNAAVRAFFEARRATGWAYPNDNVVPVRAFGLDADAEVAVLGGNARRLIAAVQA